MECALATRDTGGGETSISDQEAHITSYFLQISQASLRLNIKYLSTYMVPSAQARLSVFTSSVSISAAGLTCDASVLIVNLWTGELFKKSYTYI